MHLEEFKEVGIVRNSTLVPFSHKPRAREPINGIGKHISPRHNRCKSTSERSPEQDQRRQDKIIFWQAIDEIPITRNPALFTAELQQSFISTYLSADVIEANGPFYRVFYWHAPQNNALQAARDALCCVHLGHKFDDQRLLIDGRKSHVAALRTLRRDLERLSIQDRVEDGTIAASFTLGNTEIYNASANSGSGYRQHMDGLENLYRRRGVHGLDSEFAQTLLHNTRHPSIMDHILRRKPGLFSEPDWIAAGEKSPSLGAHLATLALRIPGLLQRVDRLEQEKQSSCSLLSELTLLERKLQEWLRRFYSLTSKEDAPYRKRSIDRYPKFHELCGGLGHVFPTVIEFPSFTSATSHMYAWTCILIVRRAILTVVQSHLNPLVRPQTQHNAFTNSVTECAVDLCQTIAYLSQPQHESSGVLACGPALYFASTWFAERNAVQRLAWTRHVREFLERDSSLGGGSGTSHRLDPPVFLYWMLPHFIADESD